MQLGEEKGYTQDRTRMHARVEKERRAYHFAARFAASVCALAAFKTQLTRAPRES